VQPYYCYFNNKFAFCQPACAYCSITHTIVPMHYTNLQKYIYESWHWLKITQPDDSETHLGVPYTFIAQSVHREDGFVFQDLFYGVT